jgi:hypothetical protein
MHTLDRRSFLLNIALATTASVPLYRRLNAAPTAGTVPSTAYRVLADWHSHYAAYSAESERRFQLIVNRCARRLMIISTFLNLFMMVDEISPRTA